MTIDTTWDSERCEILASSGLHAFFNLVLLLLLIASCTFKVLQVVRQQSTKGLSFWYLFLGALFQISQVCIVFISFVAFSGLVGCERYVSFIGFGALNPLLLLLLSVTILASALTALSLAMKYGENEGSNSREDRSPSESLACPSQTSSVVLQPMKPRNVWAIAVLFLYIVVFLVPSLLWVTAIVRNLGLLFLVPWLKSTLRLHFIVLPFLNVGQFIPEIRLMWKERKNLISIPMNLSAFAAETIVFIMLGISWRQYISRTEPNLLNIWYGLRHPLSWQQGCTLMWLGYVVLGIGQGFILALYLYLRYRSAQVSAVADGASSEDEADEAGETRPLLGEEA